MRAFRSKSCLQPVLSVKFLAISIVFLRSEVSAISTPGEVKQVLSVAGDSVRLPCDVRSSRPGDEPVLVLWYKGSDNTLLYSFNLNEASDRAGKVLASEAVGERAQFLLEPSGSLLLDPVHAEDDAKYRCRVDFSDGPTRNTYLNLTVLVAPPPPSILHSGMLLSSGHLGPLQDHGFVTLVCVSEGGRPASSLSWHSGDQLLDDSYSVESVLLNKGRQAGFGQRSINSVTLAPLSRDRNPLVVRCQAENTASVQPAVSQLIISANFGPNNVQIVDKPLSALVANRTYSVHCRASGSFPPANITCSLSGRELLYFRQEVWPKTGVTDAYLEFTPSWKDNGGELTCQASNSLLSNSTIVDRHKLNVRFAPVANTRLGHALDNEKIHEGTDVYFDCVITANPRHYDVAWFCNNKTMDGRNAAGQTSDLISITGTSLVIRNLTRRSSGLYQCQASNTEGHTLSAPVPLAVKHAPVCKSDQRIKYSTDLMQPVQVTCQVTARPGQVNFRWQFNNSFETLDLPAAQVKSSGATSVITHRPRSSSDYGSLRCWADNQVGRMSQPCVFHIAVPAVPEPVHLCSIYNQTASSLEVECRAGDDGGSPQTFHAHVFDASSGKLLRNVSSRSPGHPRFIMRHLAVAGAQNLQLHVFASNLYGRSRPVVLSLLQLAATEQKIAGAQGETWSAAELSLTPLYGVFIGVAVSLLAVAAAATACIRRGSGRKQVTRTDLLSPTSAVKSNVQLKPTVVTASSQQQQLSRDQQSDHVHLQHINPDIIPDESTANTSVRGAVLLGVIPTYNESGSTTDARANSSTVQNHGNQSGGVERAESDVLAVERCVLPDTRHLGQIIAERVARNGHLLTVLHSPYPADQESAV